MFCSLFCFSVDRRLPPSTSLPKCFLSKQKLFLLGAEGSSAGVGPCWAQTRAVQGGGAAAGQQEQQQGHAPPGCRGQLYSLMSSPTWWQPERCGACSLSHTAQRGRAPARAFLCCRLWQIPILQTLYCVALLSLLLRAVSLSSLLTEKGSYKASCGKGELPFAAPHPDTTDLDLNNLSTEHCFAKTTEALRHKLQSLFIRHFSESQDIADSRSWEYSCTRGTVGPTVHCPYLHANAAGKCASGISLSCLLG